LTAGVGAAWKMAQSVSGGKVTVAGEGALTGVIGGRVNAKGEFDLYKFANVGYAVASKVASAGYDTAAHAANAGYDAASNAVYSGDNRARQAIAQGMHKTASLPARAQMIRDLLLGRTDPAEQDAILEVLRDARARGDLAALVDDIGFHRLSFALDGSRNAQYHALVGH